MGFFFAPTAVFGEMWGVMFLQQVYDLPVAKAASLNGLIFIGWIIGGPLLGWYSDRLAKRKVLMFTSCLLLTICLIVIIFVLGMLLVMFGMSNSGVSIGYTLSTEINIPAVSGTSLAFANMTSVLIGTLLLPVFGWILDNIGKVSYINNVPVYSIQAFQYAFLPVIIGLVLGLLLVIKIKDVPRGNIRN